MEVVNSREGIRAEARVSVELDKPVYAMIRNQSVCFTHLNLHWYFDDRDGTQEPAWRLGYGSKFIGQNVRKDGSLGAERSTSAQWSLDEPLKAIVERAEELTRPRWTVAKVPTGEATP